MSDPAVNAARVHIAAGRLEQARAALAQAVARKPSAGEAINLLAWTLMQQGNLAQARFYAQRACDLMTGSRLRRS